MTWRVLATQLGYYNQQEFFPGEVFDLLNFADGTYPHAVTYHQKKDAQGKDIPDEFEERVVLGADKQPVHRDFALDEGEKLMKKGPKRGEVIRFGWMKRVPDRTPIGQYPVKDGICEVDFWTKGVQLPQPYQSKPTPRERGPESAKRNHAPILDVLPAEQTSEAA